MSLSFFFFIGTQRGRHNKTPCHVFLAYAQSPMDHEQHPVQPYGCTWPCCHCLLSLGDGGDALRKALVQVAQIQQQSPC